MLVLYHLFVLRSTPIFNRCVPSVRELINQTKYGELFKYFHDQWLHFSIDEVCKQSNMIVGLILVAIVICLVFIFLMRYIAKIMTIVLLVCSCLGCIGMKKIFFPLVSMYDNINTLSVIHLCL
jgi:hypothetical protein